MFNKKANKKCKETKNMTSLITRAATKENYIDAPNLYEW
jgi:hypothetical protein